MIDQVPPVPPVEVLIGVGVAGIQPGMRIRWMDRSWRVNVVHYHPRWGYFFNCTAEDDGAYELININGNDVGIEVLAAA